MQNQASGACEGRGQGRVRWFDADQHVPRGKRHVAFTRIGNVVARYLIGLTVLIGLGGILDAKVSAPDRRPPAHYVTIFDSGSTSEIMDTNYPSLFPSTFAPFGGRYILHFGARLSFDGQPPEQVVVIEF